MTVSRETVAAVAGHHELDTAVVARLGELVAEHDLPATALDSLAALLAGLAAEESPPTTVAAPAEAVDVHVADSLAGLAVAELRAARTVADVGAGAGFPGLALAAALTGARIDLVEATARKCETIERLAARAELTGARAVHARAEEHALARRGAYDAVTARALAPLAVVAEYAAPLLREGGTLVAWKGRLDDGELADGRAAGRQLGLEVDDPVAVRPFRAARDRRLVVARKVAPTPDRFPRRAGMARKRPLVRSVRP